MSKILWKCRLVFIKFQPRTFSQTPGYFFIGGHEEQTEFERMESSSTSSEVRQSMEKAGKEIINQLKVIKYEKKIETRSRNTMYPKRKQVAVKLPEAVRNPRFANKCD